MVSKEDNTLPPLLRIIKYTLIPNRRIVSVVLFLTSIIGLLIFDTLDRSIVVEEHGFIATGARATFDSQWTDMSMNLSNVIRKEVEYSSVIDQLCRKSEKVFAPYIKTRNPEVETSGCQLRCEEQKHFMYHYLHNNAVFSKSKHPMLKVLLKLLTEPFLVNVKDQWLGPNHGLGPTRSGGSTGKNVKTRQFQLHDVTIHNSSLADPQIAVIVPSHRGDSRDLFVIMFTYDWDDPRHYNVPGLAITLARFLSTVPWNSRDIVLVIADNKAPYAAATEGFVHSSLHLSSPLLYNGVIRMAIVINAGLPGVSSDEVFLDIEGSDGLLPNQDFPNVFKLEAAEQKLFAQTTTDWFSLTRLATNYAVHKPHTPFLKQAIPSFTVDWNYKKLQTKATIEKLARTLEAVTRAQSNVLQSLHHSFNFYFYTSITSHVSSGIYLFILVPAIIIPAFWATSEKQFWDAAATAPAIGFLLLIVLLQLPTILLATMSIEDVSPTCSGTNPVEMPIYTIKVAIWLLSALTGAVIAIALLLIYDMKSKSSKEPCIPFSESFIAVIRLWGSGVLILLMLINWSLAVPLTLWLIPGLLLLRSLNPRVLLRNLMNSNKTDLQRILSILLAITFATWMALTIIFIAPFKDRLQMAQVQLFETVTTFLKTYSKSVLFYPSFQVLELFGLTKFVPQRITEFLSFGMPFILTSESSLGHPLIKHPPMPMHLLVDTIRNRKLPGFIESIILKLAYHLSPNFVLQIYEMARDARCANSSYFVQLWFSCVPILISIPVIGFLLSADGDRKKFSTGRV